MPNRITFERKVLASGQHAILSPDIQGFCIVGAPGETRQDVERQAVEAVMLLRAQSSEAPPGITAIEFAAA